MKSLKKRSKSFSKHTPSTVLSLGHYDINYSITLSEDDVLKFHIDDVTQLTKYEDISFIVENQYLWDKIQMKTENKAINLLLYINKISIESNKTYIEYVPYEKPVFYNESVKNMLKTVNDINFFFVNKNSLYPDLKKYFSLTIKYKDKETVFNFDKSEEDEKNNNVDNEIQKEGSSEENANDNEQNENNGLKNEDNPFNKIKLDCTKYNYFICCIEETLEIKKYEDFIEFAVFIKLNYGALITIEYGDVSEYFADKDSMTLLNKLYLITDIFLFDQIDTIHNFKKHYEIFTKEKSKKVYFDDKKSNRENLSYEALNKENRSDYYTEDNKSQMSSNINKNNQNRFNNIVSRKNREMTEKDIFEYFKRNIACNGALSILNSKLGIFIDNNFSKVTFIEVPMNIRATMVSYDIKPYPKITPQNVDKIGE